MIIDYVGFYDNEIFEKRNLQTVPSAVSKMDYIAGILSKTDNVQIVSVAWTASKKGYYHQYKNSVNEKIRLVSFSTFGAKSKVSRCFKYLFSLVQLFGYLLKKKRGDTVIAYHSLYTMTIVCLTQRIKKYNLILEVEEVYGDVRKIPSELEKVEKRIINSASGYILSTKQLEKVIPRCRPALVVNGTYKVAPDRGQRFDDGKIHCVYAGTFDPTKGGGSAAAAAAFLPENYHVHILGFGTEQQKKDLIEQIKEVQKICKCTLTYDGLKSGEEYICFLQKCQIGLCTQIPDAKYTETSFPSKILVYMANGLRVLSPRIKAVEESSVGDLIYYYENQTSECIANSIKEIDFSQPYDSRTRLQQLDKQFAFDLQNLLKGQGDDAPLTN